MKKILLTTIFTLSCFALVACGDDDSPPQQPAQVNKPSPSPTPGEGEKSGAQEQANQAVSDTEKQLEQAKEKAKEDFSNLKGAVEKEAEKLRKDLQGDKKVDSQLDRSNEVKVAQADKEGDNSSFFEYLGIDFGQGGSNQPTAAQKKAEAVVNKVASATTLENKFNMFLDDTETPEEVERAAGIVIAEIYNEDEQIRPKIWEVQHLVKERANKGLYNAPEAEKVKILETGLAMTALERKRYGIGKDAAVILGSAFVFAMFRGYGGEVAATAKHLGAQGAELGKKVAEAGSKAASSVANGVGKAGQAIGAGAVAVGNGAASAGKTVVSREFYESTYGAGKRAVKSFEKAWHKLTPKEKLDRNLRALGLSEQAQTQLSKKILTQSQFNVDNYKKVKFQKTNVRGLKVFSVAKPDSKNAARYGYFVFKQSHGPRLSTQPFAADYFKTKVLSKAEHAKIKRHLAYGKDNRTQLVTVFDEPTAQLTQTRVPVDRFKQMQGKLVEFKEASKNGYKSTLNRLTRNFNVKRATQTFLTAGLLMTGGYALSSYSDQWSVDGTLGSDLLLERQIGSSPTMIADK